ncbi:32962_t:CDS:2, partial [Racocetra persica]
KGHWSTKYKKFSSYKDNEDSISIDLELGNQYSQAKGFSFFGVYDGHGLEGKKVSEICSEKLSRYVAKNLLQDYRDQTKVKSAIKKGFKQTEQDLKLELFSTNAGSTAVMAVMILLKDLIIVYVGDSSAFISSNRLFAKITKEHDLYNKSEILWLRTQKKNCGYSIRFAPNKREKYWDLNNISGRGIQYTRSFGDFYIKDKAKNSLIG